MHATTATTYKSTAACFTPKISAWRPLEPLSIDVAAPSRQKGDDAQLLCSRTQARVHLTPQDRVANMLGAILDLLSTTHSLSQVLDYITTQAGPLLDATASALYRLDGADDSLRLQSSWGLPVSFSTFARIPLLKKPAMRDALAENRPIVIPSLVRDPFAVNVTERSCQQILLASGSYTMLVVPLTVDDECYGALFLYFIDLLEFTEEEMALALTFGRKAACAIENALAWPVHAQLTSPTESEGGIPARKR